MLPISQLYTSGRLTCKSEVLPEALYVSKARDISPLPSDERMWTFLRHCLSSCLEQHHACGTAQNTSWTPRRLLRLINSPQQEVYLQLVDTNTHTPTSRYITLSHCWGATRPLCTTSANIDSHGQHIEVEALPATFRNCVVVAQQLCVHYIWIDSLCIMQDQNSDWAQHSEIMDKIYENALATVAAVASPSSTIPFLGADAPTERRIFQSISLGGEQLPLGIKARRCDTLLSSGFIVGPLEERAWVWQERRLSVRTINFTTQEVHWCCRAISTCECAGENALVKSHPGLEKLSCIKNDWRWDVVSSFSTRALTYATDRLPALSGYASRFQVRSGSEYAAGLWLSNIPKCLAWYRRNLCDCNCSPGPRLGAALNNAVPSWSWASVKREVWWPKDSERKPNTVECTPLTPQLSAELVYIHCLPSTDNKFGEVQSGAYIELTGRVIEGEMECDIHGCGSFRPQGRKPQLVTPDCLLISETTNNQTKLRRALPEDRARTIRPPRIKGSVTCLLLYCAEPHGKCRARVLILGKPSDQDGVYQRLGAGNMPEYEHSLYNNRKHWHIWKDWENLEEWEHWEEFLASAENRKLRII
jgi:hypothetical protein